jgi:UDP-glucuronate decarboxylase
MVRRPDITLAKSRLNNWQPVLPIDDGLRITIDYFKELLKS